MRALPLTLTLPLTLALTLALPQGAAYVNLCWAPADTCVYSWSFDAGEGTCDEPADDAYAFRTFRAAHDDGNTSREVEVRNDCDAHAREEGNTTRSSLRIHYTERDRDTNEWSWLWVDWAGQDAPSGSTCSTDVWIHDMENLPEGSTDHGCPAGQAPFVLRVLP